MGDRRRFAQLEVARTRRTVEPAWVGRVEEFAPKQGSLAKQPRSGGGVIRCGRTRATFDPRSGPEMRHVHGMLLGFLVSLWTIGCMRQHNPGDGASASFARAPPPRPTPSAQQTASQTDVRTGATPPRTDASSSVGLPPGPPICSRADCGPAPMYPSWRCSDESYVGGRGPCLRHDDGRCGWTHLACPDRPTCTARECGSPPAVRRWACPDGEHTGELGPCRMARDGRCGWVHRPCPPSSVGPPSTTPPPPSSTGMHPCDPLPRRRELETWEVGSVCRPGGGPRPPPLKKRLSLGDGTFIFEGPAGCFRARYRRCYSK